MIKPMLWGFAGMAVLLIALRIWNYFSRCYNDGILAGSACSACGAVLGKGCIPPARQKWRDEIKTMRAEGRTGVRRSNLELRCTHCGEVNYERDLYAKHKQRG